MCDTHIQTPLYKKATRSPESESEQRERASRERERERERESLSLPPSLTYSYQKMHRNAGNVSIAARKGFTQEIELGKLLGSDAHPNIVNFLGCVTSTGWKIYQ